jgi:hypothetical protein
MSDPKTTELFDTLAKVLLRCGIFGYLLLLLSVGLILIAGDPIYRLNGSLFGLSKHELELIIYECIVLMKVIVLLFFLIPWLAIRLVLRKAGV